MPPIGTAPEDAAERWGPWLCLILALQLALYPRM